VTILAARALSVSYDARTVLHAVDVDVSGGEILAIVGPNGAGKTTLLRALAGVVPAEGQVTIDGRALSSLSRREIAQHIAVVPQDVPSAPGFTVRDVVAMGRAPHQSAWLRERAEDAAAIDDALARCSLGDLRDRPFDALSGGERKRVLIAQALAQSAKVLLLDEPSAFLDLGHAVATFELARKEAERGIAIAAIVHDFGLAARYADRVLLLAEGRVAALGSPSEILDEAHLSAAFAVPIRRLADGATLAFAPGGR
jgi:iron complex transport system ATP-binding protein